eukprot:213763-Karenia_brevis.AAC.1
MDPRPATAPKHTLAVAKQIHTTSIKEFCIWKLVPLHARLQTADPQEGESAEGECMNHEAPGEIRGGPEPPAAGGALSPCEA